jgi:hypothetical protein
LHALHKLLPAAADKVKGAGLLSLSASAAARCVAPSALLRGTKYRRGALSQLIVVGELVARAGGEGEIAMDCGGRAKSLILAALTHFLRQLAGGHWSVNAGIL